MATVAPFGGLRYSVKQGSRLSALVTPPYDIISPQDQNRFYRSHPHNIIRLEYGRIRPEDNEASNRYTRARRTLQTWLAEKILAVDAKSAFYVMRTTFTDPYGIQREFTGVMARVKLEPLGEGSILPHERTFQGPKTDRLNLLETTGVSFSPVFSLYQDSQGACSGWLKKITRRKPWSRFKDWSGAGQSIWVVDQPADIRFFQTKLQTKKLLIADGHHRYATALNYREQHRSQPLPGDDYVMMCLADTADPGLAVLPVFRMVRHVPERFWSAFRTALEPFFEIEKVGNPSRLLEHRQAAAQECRRPVLGAIGGLGPGAHLLKLKTERFAAWAAQDLPGYSQAYRELDVVMIDRLILKTLLGITPGEEAGRVIYTKDPKEAASAVSQGKVQAAFLPGPPGLNQIWDVAYHGETMPQKSTYFLPKLITGLVMNPLRLPSPDAD